MKPRRILATCMVAGSLAGCVLFVDPPGGSTTCHFDGEATGCGACLAQACQPKVDACCGASACGETLPALDVCARTADCAALFAANDTPEGSALAACASGSCAVACANASDDAGSDGATALDGPGADGPEDHAPVDVGDASGTACTGNQGQCSCTAGAQTPNAVVCSPASLGAASESVVCCADTSYPAAGASCACQVVGCFAQSGSCLCTPLGRLDNTTPSCAAEEWTCCIRKNALDCSCGAQACASDSVPSGGSCKVVDLLCPPGTTVVTECR